jgi:formate C-acetyltransferase
MNYAKILEFTLYNGVDKAMTGFESGLKTGDINNFTSFEELLQAFKKQISYFSDLEASSNNKLVGLYSKSEGYAFRSLFTKDCLKNGKNIYNGGAMYNHIQLECVGITNAVDSLMAIKKTIFDDKSTTLSELCEALLADFEGYELLQKMLKNAPKFGNDNEEIDSIRRDITGFLYDELRRQHAYLGGMYIPGEVVFLYHDGMGTQTGATPDGRRKGTVLADSAGASQGMDRSGPTALLNSVLKIPVDKLCTCVVCNIKFSKSLFTESKEKIFALLKTFFASGGHQIQINVCDKQTLIAARKNPDAYQNLIVRVGGFSAYFHTLSERMQDDIIERSEY